MAIIKNPITLDANWYTPSITQIIKQARIVEQIQTTEFDRQLLHKFELGLERYGNGCIKTFEKNLNPIVNRPSGDSGAPLDPFPAEINPYAYRNKKEFEQATLTIDTQRTTFVTYDTSPIINTSFDSEQLVYDYMTLSQLSNEKTIDEQLKLDNVDTWNSATVAQASQTEVIELYDLSKITDPATRQWATEQNSIKVKMHRDKLNNYMMENSTRYTNTATNYTKGTQKLYDIWSAKAIRDIASGGVQQYNPKAIDYMLPAGERIVVPDPYVNPHDAVAGNELLYTVQSIERFNMARTPNSSDVLRNQITEDETLFERFKTGRGEFVDAVLVKVWAKYSLTI